MAVVDWYDRALRLNAPKWQAWLSLPLFALYLGGVVGGSTLQGSLLPDAQMGWLQQVGGIIAVAVGASFLPCRRVIFAAFAPAGPWLLRTVLVGVSITLAGVLASVLTDDAATTHGVDYFVYQATMPGLSEELGFRGLILGLLVASLLKPASSLFRVATVLVVAAAPFAALHILEQSGFALIVLFCFTLYAGIVLGWLRLTSGSLFVAALAHNIANVGSGLLDNLWVLSGR